VLHTYEMALEGLNEGFGEDGGAVAGALGIAEHELTLIEIQIFDSQAHALGEAQPAAVEPFGHELVGPGHAVEHLVHLALGEHDGQAFRPFSAHGLQVELERLCEDVAVQEEQGAEGLVLGGGGAVLVTGEVGKEGFDFYLTHMARVPFAVEEDEASHPVQVLAFGAQRVMFAAQGVARPIEQADLGRWWGGLHCQLDEARESVVVAGAGPCGAGMVRSHAVVPLLLAQVCYIIAPGAVKIQPGWAKSPARGRGEVEGVLIWRGEGWVSLRWGKRWSMLGWCMLPSPHNSAARVL
jgi:hypothetical protein